MTLLTANYENKLHLYLFTICKHIVQWEKKPVKNKFC